MSYGNKKIPAKPEFPQAANLLPYLFLYSNSFSFDSKKIKSLKALTAVLHSVY